MEKYIEQETAIKAIYEKCHEAHWEDILRSLPAADVAPVVHGKWKLYDDGENTYYCTACNEPFLLIDGTPKQNSMNYCPNCGAKMDLEATNDD